MGYSPYIPGCILDYILLFPFSLHRFLAIVRRQVGRPLVSLLRLESNNSLGAGC